MQLIERVAESGTDRCCDRIDRRAGDDNDADIARATDIDLRIGHGFIAPDL